MQEVPLEHKAITRRFLRLRYGLAALLIISVAISSALYTWHVSHRYHLVTKDFEVITDLSTLATDALNKIYQLMSLPVDERSNYASSSRIALNQMASLHRYLDDRAKDPSLVHLRILTEPEVRGSQIIERLIERGRLLVDLSVQGKETEADIYRFSTLATANFSQVVEQLTNDAATTQTNLTVLSVYVNLGAALVLVAIVLLVTMTIFTPMESTIVAAHSELDRRAERLRDAVAEISAADRAKSEFLANMSHEIRTPMNGVMGMAELLAKTELDAKQRTFTDIIVKSGAALLTIINDILDFSKIDAGQMELDPAPFVLAEAIEDVATLVSSKVSEKDLELAVRIDPGLPDMLIGDVGRLRQIVTNLLGNAVKFTETGHVLVDVTGSRIKPGEDDGDEAVELTVRVEDTGIGIPAAKSRTIFEKFSQVDASATRKHEGTGLGLAIASALVELMGGKISVESDVGVGSTFWFTIRLPVHSEVSPARQQRHNTQIDEASVLVVDDNTVNRAILAEQMAAWNFDCAACASGTEALAILRAAAERGITIDCIILDYQMPGMNGGDVARAVRDDPAFGDIPIIMLTSVDQLEEGGAFSSLDIQAHLAKPARMSLLHETLVGVLAESRIGQAANAMRAIADSADEHEESGETPQQSHHLDDEVRAPQTANTVQAEVAVEHELQPLKADPQASPNAGDLPATVDAHDEATLDVLVCEDNEVNQTLFSQILQLTGYSFQIAGDGQAGLEACQRSRPRIVLMDIAMPDMNGLEATRQIRAMDRETGNHTPIIGVSAHVLNGDRDKCMEAGMDDFLGKPVSPDKLIEKIEAWLSGEAITKGAKST